MSKKAPKSAAAAAAAPRLAAALPAAELEKCWQQLGAALKERDVPHAHVQTLAEKIFQSSVLSGSPDADALEVLSVALVQQSRWAAAVALLSGQSALVAANQTLAFHLAYSLYRDKQLVKSLDELRKRSAAGLSEGELHLQAQAFYRAGNYKESAKVYSSGSLAKSTDPEVQANALAALVGAGQLDDAKAYLNKLGVAKNPASFELAYNASCALIEAGDLTGAQSVLAKARALGQEQLASEGVPEAEIQDELAVLQVQEGFILQSLSSLPGARGDELSRAGLLYASVLKANPSDKVVASIASNNQITLPHQPGAAAGGVWEDIKKSGKAVSHMDLKDMTLSVKQKSALQLNRALALLAGRQADKAREVLSALAREVAPTAAHVLAMSAALVKDKATKEAEDALSVWIKINSDSTGPEAVQQVQLGQVHLALMKGDVASAANQLVGTTRSKTGQSLAHKPATVATLVALYERSGDINAATAVIQEAVKHWKALSAADATALRHYNTILSSAGEFFSRVGRSQDAAAMLEALAEQTTASSGSAAAKAESVARLILAYRGDAGKVAQYSKQLPALVLPASMDVKQLESVPAPEVAKRRVAKAKKAAAAPVSASAPAPVEVRDEDDEDEDEPAGGASALSASLAAAATRAALRARQKKKKSTRVPRYPKGFDPANPGPLPDPERWLPRWERSNQKKFARRRAGNAIRGAQGSTNMAQGAQKETADEAVESRGKVSGAAAAAARKRAGKAKK